MLLDTFEIASGTVPGRNHIGRNGLLIGQNNQDGMTILTEPDALIAVVTDGCGSQGQSEVGSRLGARLLANEIAARMRRSGDTKCILDPRFFERVRQDLLARIRVLALELAGEKSLTETIAEYFLFTAIAAVITEETTTVVGIGDGLVCMNGQQYALGPYPGNKPPYLTYELIETEFSSMPELLRFKEVVTVPTEEVDSLLVATDGAIHLHEARKRTLPGRQDQVGELSRFWEEDRFFRNRDAVRRWLSVINSSVTYRESKGHGVLTDEGLLPDDTTLVVIRRKERS